jgi:hypothetical protein
MASGGKKATPAIAYLRTSSAVNVGAEQDSDKRQRAAIEAFARPIEASPLMRSDARCNP